MFSIWRGHYVAALLDASVTDVTRQLEDKGFEVIAFDGDEPAWAASFDRLAKALGRSS